MHVNKDCFQMKPFLEINLITISQKFQPSETKLLSGDTVTDKPTAFFQKFAFSGAVNLSGLCEK